MKKKYTRKKFLLNAAITGLGAGILPKLVLGKPRHQKIGGEISVGIIGLDTSHSTAFVGLLNAENKKPQFVGFRVTVAYPYGSRDIKSSYERIPSYIEKVKASGVEIVNSIGDLLKKCDVVLLETNDGKPRLEQTMQVLRAGKKVFIDKPVAARFADAVTIYKTAEKLNVPVFSSSALRYTSAIENITSGKTIGKVLGADIFTPAPTQPGHIDLVWYGIHGVEPLFTLMGTGCKELKRTFTADTDLITATWADGRIGTVRGIRKGADGYGGTVFGEKGIAPTGGYDGYEGLLIKILDFFRTGISPVAAAETLEIYTFMEAADESKRLGGKAIELKKIAEKYKLYS